MQQCLLNQFDTNEYDVVHEFIYSVLPGSSMLPEGICIEVIGNIAIYGINDSNDQTKYREVFSSGISFHCHAVLRCVADVT